MRPAQYYARYINRVLRFPKSLGSSCGVKEHSASFLHCITLYGVVLRDVKRPQNWSLREETTSLPLLPRLCAPFLGTVAEAIGRADWYISVDCGITC